MTCKQVHDLLVESLYGELDEARARELDAHLAGCAACAALHEEMRSTVATMHERRRPDPGDEYFDEFYARLEDRMAREGSVVDGARVAARRRSNVSWGYRVAAAVAVLAVGVWLGRSSMTPGDEKAGINVAQNTAADTTTGTPVPADSLPRENLRGTEPDPIDGASPRRSDPAPKGGGSAVLVSADERAREYIERSQVLLLALVNAIPDTNRTDVSYFQSQRARAGVLVREASTLRDDLPGGDNRRLRELVTDLQMILREIANLESQNDLDAVEIIRNRVDREGVLLKIDVEQMREDNGTGPVQPKRSGAID
jgi:hypothetical protein